MPFHSVHLAALSPRKPMYSETWALTETSELRQCLTGNKRHHCSDAHVFLRPASELPTASLLDLLSPLAGGNQKVDWNAILSG